MAHNDLHRIDCLDGLRGLAAVWVLLGHGLLLTGWHVPILGEPDLGVDLFIILSGFLMVFHYRLRAAREPWELASTWLHFWARRYFRIAPLYYSALAAASLAGPMLWADRSAIDAFLNAAPQSFDRYNDSGVANVLLHLSFAFGLSPEYSYRTPLPDWSVGLEMQFYAVFPALMLLMRWLGWVRGAVLATTLACAVLVGCKLAGLNYPMPSLLAAKLQMFLCGMLLAAGLGERPRNALAYVGLALVLSVLPIGLGHGWPSLAIRLLLAGGFAALVHHQLLAPRAAVIAATIGRTLGNRFFHWLGELSFGSYLLHLLILPPVAAWAIGRFGATLAAPQRFGLVMIIVVPAVYATAWLAYQAIEKPGQQLGRWVIRRATRRLPVVVAVPRLLP